MGFLPDHFEAVTEGGRRLRSGPLSAITSGPGYSSRDTAGFHCLHQKMTALNVDTQEDSCINALKYYTAPKTTVKLSVGIINNDLTQCLDFRECQNG